MLAVMPTARDSPGPGVMSRAGDSSTGPRDAMAVVDRVPDVPARHVQGRIARFAATGPANSAKEAQVTAAVLPSQQLGQPP